ncbi:MAG: hypothetical protein ABFD20_00800 [Anaerolineales bacterium]
MARYAQQLRATLRAHWEVLATVALVACIYAPAVGFGIIWDDPTWYQLTRGLKAIQLFGPVTSFHFYRPLALLYSRLFVSDAGIVQPALQHMLQVVFHVTNVVLVHTLARQLGLSRWAAAVAILAFAVHPFAQQAVAWQVPPQPLVTLAMLLVVLTAKWYLDQRQVRWLVLSVGILGCALFYQEVALGVWPVLVLFALQTPDQRSGWLTWYALPSAVFLGLYATMPRKAGVLGAGYSLRVAAYLLQAAAPPLGALRGLTSGWSTAVWVVILGLWTLLLVWASWRERRFAALVGLVWYVTLMAPSILGLSWAYVSVGPRVIYPGLVGVALLWGALFDAWRARATAWAGLLSCLAAVALLGTLTQITVQLQWLYAQATAHLQDTVQVLSAQPEAQFLFLNYPDRIALADPPYVLGYWGITLAPPIQQLSDYALALEGASATAQEVTRLDIGHREWDDAPFTADLRGTRVDDSDAVIATDRWYDAVYTTAVSAKGELALRKVGASARGEHPLPLARLGPSLLIVQGHAEREDPHRLRVEVTLEAVGGLLGDDVLCVQLLDTGGVLMAQVDQNLWAGFVPASALPQGALVDEVRYLDIGNLAPGDYAVVVGLYNRQTGLRYRATWVDGHEAWQGLLQIDTLRIE